MGILSWWNNLPIDYKAAITNTWLSFFHVTQVIVVVLIGAAVQNNEINTLQQFMNFVSHNWWGVFIGYVYPMISRYKQGYENPGIILTPTEKKEQ